MYTRKPTKDRKFRMKDETEVRNLTLCQPHCGDLFPEMGDGEGNKNSRARSYDLSRNAKKLTSNDGRAFLMEGVRGGGLRCARETK